MIHSKWRTPKYSRKKKLREHGIKARENPLQIIRINEKPKQPVDSSEFIIISRDCLDKLFKNIMCSECNSKTVNTQFSCRNGFCVKIY